MHRIIAVRSERQDQLERSLPLLCDGEEDPQLLTVPSVGVVHYDDERRVGQLVGAFRPRSEPRQARTSRRSRGVGWLKSCEKAWSNFVLPMPPRPRMRATRC